MHAAASTKEHTRLMVESPPTFLIAKSDVDCARLQTLATQTDALIAQALGSGLGLVALNGSYFNGVRLHAWVLNATQYQFHEWGLDKVAQLEALQDPDAAVLGPVAPLPASAIRRFGLRVGVAAAAARAVLSGARTAGASRSRQLAEAWILHANVMSSVPLERRALVLPSAPNQEEQDREVSAFVDAVLAETAALLAATDFAHGVDLTGLTQLDTMALADLWDGRLFHFVVTALSNGSESSSSNGQYLSCTSPVPLMYLSCTSPVPPLYLSCTSPVPLLYLPCTSPVPLLYLSCTSPVPLLSR